MSVCKQIKLLNLLTNQGLLAKFNVTYALLTKALFKKTFLKTFARFFRNIRSDIDTFGFKTLIKAPFCILTITQKLYMSKLKYL